MKILILSLLSCSSVFGIIVRHDRDDQEFIKKAGLYPQICHFQMGEGTLIRPKWILTAGHVGSDLKRQIEQGQKPVMLCNQKTYHVDLVMVYPEFQNLEQGLANDIALVRIAETVTDVNPAMVYEKVDEEGKPILIVGRGDWGTGLTGPVRWDKITRAATNRIDGVEPTWISFDFDAPDSKEVTVLEGVSGPGDSGGPAFIESNGLVYVAGISSFQKGQDKFGKGRYGVTEYYSRVSSYAKWINQAIEEIHTSTPIVQPSQQTSAYEEFVGTYGFRKIISQKGTLFFQRDDEPLISMKAIGKDLFLWDDNNTRIQFMRDTNKKITGFEIRRKNGEVVKVDKDK